MKSIMIAACLMVGLSGCALTPAEGYTVHIDPSFNTGEKDSINNALKDWTTKSNGYVFFSVQYDIIPGNSGSHDIMINKSTRSDIWSMSDGKALGLTLEESFNDTGSVYLPSDVSDPVRFQTIAGHEVGHAMGLAHDAKGTIMAPGIADAAKTATCEDVAQLHSVRNDKSFYDCTP